MTSFTIEPYQNDFHSLVLQLQAALPEEAITEAHFTRKVLLDPNFDPAGMLIARSDSGEIIGSLLAIVRKRPLEDGKPDQDRGWITLFAVAEEARRQGVGTALFVAAENWLRSQNRTSVWIAPYAPHYWIPGVDEAAYPEALRFLHQRGYETILRPLSMEVALTSNWRPPQWALERTSTLNQQEIRVIAFRQEDAFPLTHFLRREFPGDWQRYLRETMLDIILKRRAEQELLLAIDFRHDEIVGFAQSEGERFGPFGVAQASRGQGIGAVLLSQALAGMCQRGHARAWFLWTDDTTAERIYKPFGFHETRRYSLLKKQIG